MKKIFKFSVIASVMFIGFSILSCDLDPGGDKEPGSIPAGTTFSIKGTFDGKIFSIANAENYARSVSADSYAIRGELEDGDIVFRLTGTYDPIARNFIASAASSIIRFTISGSFNEAGVSLGTTATVTTRPDQSSDNWTSVSHIVTETAVTITSTIDAEEDTGGIPSFAWGWWKTSGQGWKMKLLFSQWAILQEYEENYEGNIIYDSLSASVIEANYKGGYWDLIFSYPVYIGTKEQVETAATEYLASKGLTGELLPANPFPPDWVYMTNWYYVYSPGEHDYFQYNFNIVENIGPNPIDWENSLTNQLNIALGEYSISFLYPESPTKAQWETFIASWFANKGIPVTKLTIAPPEFNPIDAPGIFYFYDASWNDIRWGYGGDWFALSAAQRKVIENAQIQWWSTHYLERYLIDQGVSPTTKYSKCKAVFTHSNTRITLLHYITGTQENPVWEWNTITEARNATIIEDQEPVVLTR
ncbi:MAG: hypothetical protein FWD24_02330 [Treponema sp.]|nr:hypothetical protein [Treponema sp.]